MKKIVEANARPDYHVWIRFEDGLEGEIDLSDFVGKGVFQAWEDPQFFDKVFVDRDTDTIAWPGGIDLCSDTLYEDLTRASVH